MMEKITFEQLPEIAELIVKKLDRLEQLMLDLLSAPTDQRDQLLTIQQAAEFLHLTVHTLYSYTHRNAIPFSRRGKRLYFSRTELEHWIKTGQMDQTQ
jgi:excisionase family DNA binding protein